MNEIDFLVVLKELFPNSSLLLLTLWSLWLLKTYVINGNIKKYFELKEKETALVYDMLNRIIEIERQHKAIEELALRELDSVKNE